MSRSQCETFLNTWIAQYVTTDDSASQERSRSTPARGPYRRHGGPWQAGCLQGDRVPPSSLPTRRTHGLAPNGGGTAAARVGLRIEQVALNGDVEGRSRILKALTSLRS